MEDFNWESFSKKIAIKAAVKELYNAWTVPAEIEKWFLSKAVFDRLGEQVPHNEQIAENDVYHWSWFLFDQVESGRIVRANGTDRIHFTFAGDCLVEVTLTQENDVVIVSLTQSNIPTDNHSKQGIRLGCDSGWSFFLVNLKSVFEGGIDLRNKDENLRGMLNN
jgi:uncharacterized protein YndB with AHSA1/START domain